MRLPGMSLRLPAVFAKSRQSLPARKRHTYGFGGPARFRLERCAIPLARDTMKRSLDGYHIAAKAARSSADPKIQTGMGILMSVRERAPLQRWPAPGDENDHDDSELRGGAAH
jgi:hypothetical protein